MNQGQTSSPPAQASTTYKPISPARKTPRNLFVPGWFILWIREVYFDYSVTPPVPRLYDPMSDPPELLVAESELNWLRDNGWTLADYERWIKAYHAGSTGEAIRIMDGYEWPSFLIMQALKKIKCNAQDLLAMFHVIEHQWDNLNLRDDDVTVLDGTCQDIEGTRLYEREHVKLTICVRLIERARTIVPVLLIRIAELCQRFEMRKNFIWNQILLLISKPPAHTTTHDVGPRKTGTSATNTAYVRAAQNLIRETMEERHISISHRGYRALSMTTASQGAEKMKQLFDQMKRDGVKPDGGHLALYEASILHSASKPSLHEAGSPSLPIVSSHAGPWEMAVAKLQAVQDARTTLALFDQLRSERPETPPDLWAWYTLLDKVRKETTIDGEAMKRVWLKILEDGVVPNNLLVSQLIRSLGEDLVTAKWLLKEAKKLFGIPMDHRIVRALLKIMRRQEDLRDLYYLVQRNPGGENDWFPDAHNYNGLMRALISRKRWGVTSGRQSKEAWRFYCEMREKGILPNGPVLRALCFAASEGWSSGVEWEAGVRPQFTAIREVRNWIVDPRYELTDDINVARSIPHQRTCDALARLYVETNMTADLILLLQLMARLRMTPDISTICMLVVMAEDSRNPTFMEEVQELIEELWPSMYPTRGQVRNTRAALYDDQAKH